MKFAAALLAAPLLLAACASNAPLRSADLVAGCAALAGPIGADKIGLPSGGAVVDSAQLVAASRLKVAESGPGGAAAITPAAPEYCKLLGHVAPVDPQAPPVRFEVNLPTNWNGRSVQLGGGGFNGVLVTGLGLVPSGRFDQPSPLARGYATAGTDSGHTAKPGEAPQAFALNDEAFANFAHAAYKKVHDVSLELIKRAYGRAPEHMYYVGSSEGGREALTMAQRYPDDFDGIFARVPVISFTGLQHAGTRAGLASRGEAWLRPAQVQAVQAAVLAACDAADGLADGIVSDVAGCLRRFDITTLRCAAGVSGDSCLSEAQINAVQTLHSPYRFPFALANGVTEYPGWGVSGEAAAGSGSAGGWGSWWLGSRPPELPPVPGNGIAWVFGSGTLQYLIAKDPAYDVARYRPEDFADRVRQVSALIDSTNPDLGPFQSHGGKLIVLEHLSDYAQSPFAGIGYVASVEQRLGAARSASFLRLYTAPGVDHVGGGAPANVDMLAALAGWVEKGQPPAGLELVEQPARPPFAVSRSRPLCRWPSWPRYQGGDPDQAASFECTP